MSDAPTGTAYAEPVEKAIARTRRWAGFSRSGEILVSSLLRQIVESSVDAGTFGEPRDVDLKGLAGTHTVFAVRVS